MLQVKTDLGNLTFIDLNYEASVNTLESNQESLKCDKVMDELFDKTLLIKIGNSLLDNFGCTVPFAPLSDEAIYLYLLSRNSEVSTK